MLVTKRDPHVSALRFSGKAVRKLHDSTNRPHGRPCCSLAACARAHQAAIHPGMMPDAHTGAFPAPTRLHPHLYARKDPVVERFPARCRGSLATCAHSRVARHVDARPIATASTRPTYQRPTRGGDINKGICPCRHDSVLSSGRLSQCASISVYGGRAASCRPPPERRSQSPGRGPRLTSLSVTLGSALCGADCARVRRRHGTTRAGEQRGAQLRGTRLLSFPA